MRRRHLFAPIGLLGLAVAFLLGRGAGDRALAAAQSSYPAVATSTKPPLVVANSAYRLLIDSERGTIVSFRSTFGVARELLIPDHGQLPLLKIELMSDRYEFKTVTSAEAKEVKVSKAAGRDGSTLSIEFKEMGQLPVDARVTVRCPESETLTYWNLEVDNRTTSGSATSSSPWSRCRLTTPRQTIQPHPLVVRRWRGVRTGGTADERRRVGLEARRTVVRKGLRHARNLALQQLSRRVDLNPAHGLLQRCGRPLRGLRRSERIAEVHRSAAWSATGSRWGWDIIPGTRGPGETKLPYNVVLGTFHGDWYAAAEIYRDWASKQPFCATKLAQRTDIPKWIADSPPAIAFPMRGQGDWDPPAAENPEYTPLTNALPYLDKAGRGARKPADADHLQLGARRALGSAGCLSRPWEAKRRFASSCPRRKRGAGIP